MSELPKLVLNRDYTLNTKLGHSVFFKKGEPTVVSKLVYAEAIAIGALPVDGADPNVIADSVPSKEPVDPAERAPQIKAAIELLVERNARNDFTASGAPTAVAVSEAVGYKVQAKEIAAVWQAIADAKQPS